MVISMLANKLHRRSWLAHQKAYIMCVKGTCVKTLFCCWPGREALQENEKHMKKHLYFAPLHMSRKFSSRNLQSSSERGWLIFSDTGSDKNLNS